MTANNARMPKPEDHREPMTDEEGEIRELTEADFALFQPTNERPEGMAALKRAGRLPLPPEVRKPWVTLHLDPDLVDRLKAEGKGWQTRVNAALQRGMKV